MLQKRHGQIRPAGLKMSEAIKLLLVEDEETLATIVKESLQMIGFEVEHASNGQEGLDLFLSFRPEICIIDVMMPKKDGISLALEIRAADVNVPIIFLSSKGDTKDILDGFEAGADDYMKKPFSIQELTFRINAIIKRTKGNTAVAAPSRQLSIGAYLFDAEHQELIFHGEVKRLSHRESELIKTLTDSPNSIQSRKEILLKLWGDDSIYNSKSLDVYISKIRKYLQMDKNIQIINIRGLGYKLIV